MNHLRTLLLFVVALLITVAAEPLHAQLAIYGGYSGASTRGGTTDWAYGPMFGIYKQSGYLASTVNIGGDLRGSLISRNGFNFYTGAAGPRVAFKLPVIPLRPYVEGLVGVANYNSGNGTGSTTHFNYQIVGGLDFTFFPKLDWRVVDFAYSAVSGQNVNAKILSTGLVIRIW
jgi:hypothetical protein